MKFVHFLCLQKWVVVKNSNICDICAASLKDLPQELLQGLPQRLPQTVRRELVQEDHHLPMNLKIGMAIMWVYTGAIILLPLFIRHLEGKAL